MGWILVTAVILVIAIVILVKPSHKGEAESANYPYQKIGVLFSPAERSFLGVLNQVVGQNSRIFGKVRVADVMAPKKGLSRGDWQKAFNKISGKHFDFLLCRNDDLSVICAIELDDRSHQSKKRQQRDEFLRGACNASGVPLIQIPAKSGYVLDDVKKLIAPHINTNEVPSQEPEPSTQESSSNERLCPKCSSSMVIRTSKKGSNAGNQFWGCSAYPKCRHIEAIRT